MQTLTDILYSRVLTADGKCIGHVFDLRCANQGADVDGAGGHCVVDELVYGTQGMLAAIGLAKAQAKAIAWSDVAQFEDGEIILRAGAHERARDA